MLVAGELGTPAASGLATVLLGDCREVVPAIIGSEAVSTAFCDPPYFLSNGGATNVGGERVSVDIAPWDRSRGWEADHRFNEEWLSAVRDALDKDGTAWLCGNEHNIASLDLAVRRLAMRRLNWITWEKPNPPPNLHCRMFTHSTEFVLWVAKSERSRHFFDYEAMRAWNHSSQMKTVWKMTTASPAERRYGQLRAQKPLALVYRCLLASVPPDGYVLDPFCGTGTVSVVSNFLQLRSCAVELMRAQFEQAYARISEAPALVERPTSKTDRDVLRDLQRSLWPRRKRRRGGRRPAKK